MSSPNLSKILYKVPSLQSLVVKFIIEYEEINETLNPPEDWDNDTSHLFNQRISHQEVLEYEKEVLSGIKTFTQVKSEIRACLLQRPFNLDLVQLQAIPLFKGLPDVIAKEISIEAFLVQFEARLPCFLWFKLEYGNPHDLLHGSAIILKKKIICNARAGHNTQFAAYRNHVNSMRTVRV